MTWELRKMPITADCANTKSELGRNATPVEIFPSVRRVLGSIELDPCSDEVINQYIQAERYLDFVVDGLSLPWIADTVWLNPPGNSLTGGTFEDRDYWWGECQKPKGQQGDKPKGVKHISASKWYEKLYKHWIRGDIKKAIALVYRAGSLGSLGNQILSQPVCITCKGVESPISGRNGKPVVNGSGRLSFDLIDENGDRQIECTNTTSSAFVLFPDCKEDIELFKEEFSKFGVVKV